MEIVINGHAIPGWGLMSWAEKQVAIEDEAAQGYAPAGAYSLEQSESPTMVPVGYSVPTTSGNWWDQSAFADLTGKSAIDQSNFPGGMGNFGIGFGDTQISLPKLPWLLILAGVGIIVIAVAKRR